MQHDSAFAGAEVCLEPAYGRSRKWANFAFSPRSNRWLRERLGDRALAPDVVHIHGVWAHTTSAAAAWARRYSIPYGIRPAGSLFSNCLRMGRQSLKRAFSFLYLRRDLRHASFVQATSLREAEELRRFASLDQIKVVPHGVDMPRWDAKRASDGFLAEHPSLAGKRVLLYLARVTPIKRPEFLVKAMSRIVPDYPDVVLLLGGYEEPHLDVVMRVAEEHGLRDSVKHLGFLQGDAKQGAFAVADLFALPSVTENFGVSVIEAMAHGVPVLTTPGVASSRYVDQSGGGITVEDGVDAIAAGMRRLLESDRDAIGERGRRFVMEHLSWSSVANRIEDVYRDVLAEPGQESRETMMAPGNVAVSRERSPQTNRP